MFHNFRTYNVNLRHAAQRDEANVRLFIEIGHISL